MTSLPDLVAAPMQLRLGRKRMLLSPLTIGDLGIYERMGGKYDSLLSGENLTLLFWLSLRREHPDISYPRACKLVSRRNINTIATALVALNKSAFQDEPKEDKSEESTPTNYAAIFRLMSRVYGWTIEVVSRLTIEQVNVYLKDIEAGGGDRIHFNSYQEARRYIDSRKQAG